MCVHVFVCMLCSVYVCVCVCVCVERISNMHGSYSNFDCQIQCMYFITVIWQSLCWDIKHVTYVLAFYTLLSSNPI